LIDAQSLLSLRQLNGVNGADTVFIGCLSVCLSVWEQRTGQSDQFQSSLASKLQTSNFTRMFPAGTTQNFPKKGTVKVTWRCGRYTLLTRKRLKLRTSNLAHSFNHYYF